MYGVVLIYISFPSDRLSDVHPTKMIRALRPREYHLPSLPLFREVAVVNQRAFSEDSSLTNGKFRRCITEHKIKPLLQHDKVESLQGYGVVYADFVAISYIHLYTYKILRNVNLKSSSNQFNNTQSLFLCLDVGAFVLL